MVTPDETGRLWHRGTQLGAKYLILTLLIFGLTTTQDPEGSLAWLENFSFLLIIAPFAAASHAYALGRRDTLKKDDIPETKVAQ